MNARATLSALTLVVAAAAASAAGPAKVESPADGQCAFGAWSGDTDPAGLNVRTGPSADAPVAGKLPPPVFDAELGRPVAMNFRVVESRDGWFRITGSDPPGDADAAAQFPPGWISGRYVDFSIQTDLAFAEPDPRSAIVASAWRDKDGGHQISYRHPSACRGEWVRLRVAGRDGREREGWLRGICDNQDTSCGGVAGDLLDYEKLPAY